jgi:hypothetical protein
VARLPRARSPRPIPGHTLALATLIVVAASCRDHPPLHSCGEDIGGIWRSATATIPGGMSARWSILDEGQRLEIYPLFDDTIPSPAPAAGADGLVISPRSFALIRARLALPGHVQRWVMRGQRWCQARAPARIDACHGDALTLEASQLPMPEGAQLCPPGGPTVTERWLRDD